MREVKKKVLKLLKRHRWMYPTTVSATLLALGEEPIEIGVKRQKFIKIVDTMVKALEPHVACRAGCSRCCHMNTMIYEHEAKRLAEVTGRKMRTLPYRPLDVVFLEGNKFNFEPCPFLVNNKCSVYDDRPLVCRTHHSLSNDAQDCDPLRSGTPRPPMYDPDIIEGPYRVMNAAASSMEPWGNIAEFFPDGQ